MIQEQNVTLSKSTLWLMTIAAGLVVANNYYNQPLLGMIAREIGSSEAATSRIAMATQIGYACGLLIIIPLCDMVSRKKLIIVDFTFMIAALLAFSFGQNLHSLLFFSFCIGLTSVIPQVFIPITAQLSTPADRTKNIALVISGLLIGILCSRIISGIVGEHLGWREMFRIAAGAMLITLSFIVWKLPDIASTFKGTYFQLIKSIAYFARTSPILRLASLRSALNFASFSIFWTTLTFHMEGAPFYAGSDIIGAFGIFGIMGAAASSFTGKLSKVIDRNRIITWGFIILIISWLSAYFGGFNYVGIIVAVLLIDIAVQAIQICNQTLIFDAHTEASNRVNTFYMVSYFIGGSFGTYIGSLAWKYGEWTGVCIAGGAFVVLSFAVHLWCSNKPKYQIRA